MQTVKRLGRQSDRRSDKLLGRQAEKLKTSVINVCRESVLMVKHFDRAFFKGGRIIGKEICMTDRI